MEAPIIIDVESDWVLGFSVTAESFDVNRSVKSKNVVSIPSVQDIVITYSEVVVTSILEFSVKIREASANECTSYKMKNTQKRPVSEQFQNTIEN
jgi:hypothetical protein